MTAELVFLSDRKHGHIADMVSIELAGHVPPAVIAEAIARAERLLACRITRDAIVRNVVAWALKPEPPEAA